jgi:hypothetical protein
MVYATSLLFASSQRAEAEAPQNAWRQRLAPRTSSAP